MDLYFKAASFIDALSLQKTSIKSYLSSLKLPPAESKRLLALVISTLKYKPVLLQLLSLVPLTREDKRILYKDSKDGSLAIVLVHDLIFADRKGIQAGAGPIKDAVLRHKTRLNSELVKLKIKRGVTSNKELQVGGGVGDQIPRYARINTNKIEPGAMVAELQTPAGGGFTFLPSAPYPETLPHKTFRLDEHIPNLLVFPLSANAQITSHPAYLDGRLILQDKASCMPAVVLLSHLLPAGDASNYPPGEVIDATSAPGNKTTHLSAILGNKGKVHAFELSPGRWMTLRKMVDKAGCENVDYGVEGGRNFLETRPEEWEGVRYLMLDPSCSGSGIVNRLDFLTEDPEEENTDAKKDRLANLASFQIKMIRHAMQFPSALKIAYSTCSVHPEEDELVVLAALDSPEAKAGGWRLSPRSEVLPTWQRRGRKELMGRRGMLGDNVVCCEPGTDKTNGFFVSCFHRPAPHGLSSGASAAVTASKQQKKKQLALVAAAPEPAAPLSVASADAAPAVLSKSQKKKQAAKKRKLAATVGDDNGADEEKPDGDTEQPQQWPQATSAEGKTVDQGRPEGDAGGGPKKKRKNKNKGVAAGDEAE